MFSTRLKYFLPKGLYARSALILLAPIVIIQLVVSVVFIQRHFDGVTKQMVSNVVLEINLVLQAVSDAKGDDKTRQAFQNTAAPLGLGASILPASLPVRPDQRDSLDLTGKTVISTLRRLLPSTQSIDLASDTRAVVIRLRTANGDVQLVFDRRRVSASNPHQLLVLMIIASILMSIISIIFLRNQVRPIRRLAMAAEAFGRGNTVPYTVAGATEVRSAGRAFLDMRQRIERQIEQRTLMLSGVSHDLRSPLTRLKLGLSMAPENTETAAMLRDVDDMEAMLQEFLAFARGDSIEDISLCDPVALAEKVAQAAARGNNTIELDIPLKTDQPQLVSLRPIAISRAIENLISNAGRYGDRCRLQVHISDNRVSYVIEDNGPGIPQAQVQDALRPFTRLDQARNQNRGTGVGLGLSIARDIASSHGGTLELSKSSDLGGLKASLKIPR